MIKTKSRVSSGIEIPLHLVQKYIAGEATVYDIAAEIDRSVSAVYNALNDLGVDTGTYRFRMHGRNLAIIKCFSKGDSIMDIADKYDISKQRVYQILEDNAPEVLETRRQEEDEPTSAKVFDLV